MFTWPKTVKIILLATLLLPLVYTQWTIYPSHFGKTVFFQIIVALLAAGSVWYALFKEKKRVTFCLLDWLLLAFVFSSLLSSALGIEFNRSFWGDQSRVQGVFTLIHFTLFYLLARQYLKNQNDWRYVIITILIISAISSVIAWLGASTPWLHLYVPSGRLQGVIGNPIFFANYLLIPAFLGFGSFFYFSKNRWRYLWLGIGLFDVVTIIGSRTRGPLVGLLFGALVVVALYLIYCARARSRAVIISLTAIIITVLALGYIYPAVRSAFPARLQYLFSIKPGDSTAQTRLMAWQIAWDGFRERPIFGWGPESYQYVFDHKYNQRFLHFSFAETVWDQPHNYVLEILVSRGIIGFALYLAIIVLSLFYLYRLMRPAGSNRERIIFITLAGLVVGYAAGLLFSFETSNSWQLWFVLLAFISWLRWGHESRPINLKQPVRVIVLGLVGVLSVVSVYYNYQMLKSSYYTSYARDAALIQSVYLWQKYATEGIDVKVPWQWEQAFFLTKDMAILDGYQRLDREAVAEVGPKLEKVFLRFLETKPDTFLYKFWLGQVYAFMGEFVDKAYYAKAEKTLKETWAINKYRQTVPLLLSKTLGIEGKFNEAISVLQEVVAQDPTLEQPHWFLGVNLVQAGKREEGIAELEKGKNFGLGWKNNILYLIDLYAQDKQYGKIVPLYEYLILNDPENYSYYANLAATEVALGEKEKALENIKKAVELNPDLRPEAEQFIQDNKLR